MKEVHLRLWDLAMREIVLLLDSARKDADWICVAFYSRVCLLSDEQLEACGCCNCDREARLRFWVKSRREAEAELEKLGVDRPRSKNWLFGPQA